MSSSRTSDPLRPPCAEGPGQARPEKGSQRKGASRTSAPAATPALIASTTPRSMSVIATSASTSSKPPRARPGREAGNDAMRMAALHVCASAVAGSPAGEPARPCTHTSQRPLSRALLPIACDCGNSTRHQGLADPGEAAGRRMTPHDRPGTRSRPASASGRRRDRPRTPRSRSTRRSDPRPPLPRVAASRHRRARPGGVATATIARPLERCRDPVMNVIGAQNGSTRNSKAPVASTTRKPASWRRRSSSSAPGIKAGPSCRSYSSRPSASTSDRVQPSRCARAIRFSRGRSTIRPARPTGPNPTGPWSARRRGTAGAPAPATSSGDTGCRRNRRWRAPTRPGYRPPATAEVPWYSGASMAAWSST